MELLLALSGARAPPPQQKCALLRKCSPTDDMPVPLGIKAARVRMEQLLEFAPPPFFQPRCPLRGLYLGLSGSHPHQCSGLTLTWKGSGDCPLRCQGLKQAGLEPRRGPSPPCCLSAPTPCWLFVRISRNLFIPFMAGTLIALFRSVWGPSPSTRGVELPAVAQGGKRSFAPVTQVCVPAGCGMGLPCWNWQRWAVPREVLPC